MVIGGQISLSIRMIMEDTLDKWLVSDSGISSAAVRVRMAMRDMKPLTLGEIAKLTCLKPHNARRAVNELVDVGWLTDLRTPSQRPRLIAPVFPMRVARQMAREIERAFQDAAHRGEWLMKAQVDLLVGSNNYVDNCRPDWLRNVETKARLEFDRFFPGFSFVLEYQGAGHHRPTSHGGQLTQEEREQAYRSQLARDAAKLLACKNRNIEIVYITAIDLLGESLVAKLPANIPLSAYAHNPDSPLTQALNALARSYAEAVIGN